MTQSAQYHRQMRSIPHSSKDVFFMFLFSWESRGGELWENFRGRLRGGGLEAADYHAEDAGDENALVDDFEFEVAFTEHDYGIDECHEGTASAYHRGYRHH